MMDSNKDFISGIYNYCDRWCERCAFTSKCAVYENEDNLSSEQKDISNKAFWDNIHNNLALSMQLIKEDANAHGIDLTFNETELEDQLKKRDYKRDDLKNHPLIKLSKNYLIQAKLFLENNNNTLTDEAQNIINLVDLGVIEIDKAKKRINIITDCLEILQWYLIQIQVKFMRALPMDEGDEADEYFLSDSNGSAKVALIAVDRCLIAWQNIVQIFPEMQDEIIPLLGLLERMKNLGELTFPNARKFIRVGLDD